MSKQKLGSRGRLRAPSQNVHWGRSRGTVPGLLENRSHVQAAAEPMISSIRSRSACGGSVAIPGTVASLSAVTTSADFAEPRSLSGGEKVSGAIFDRPVMPRAMPSGAKAGFGIFIRCFITFLSGQRPCELLRNLPELLSDNFPPY